MADVPLAPPPMESAAAHVDDSEGFPGGLPSAWVTPEPTDAIQPSSALLLPVDASPAPSVSAMAVPTVDVTYPTDGPLPMPPPTTAKRQRIPTWVAWSVAGIFFVATVALALVAVHENSVANGWHQDYQKAQIELATAHASIKSLNTQLAAQSSAKEKALDQNSVLSKLVGQEGTVSTELNTCVTDLRVLIGTVGNDLSSGYYTDPSVSTESDTASSDCNQAQTDNRSLQSALNGATG